MNFLKSLVILSLIAPTLMLAEENHVVVGSRQMSEETASTEKTKPAAEEEGDLETAGFIFERYPPIYYSSSHHWLVAITLLDNDQYTLEFEDGSVWKINKYDFDNKAKFWQANDPLTVTQNTRWFSNHNHCIMNKNGEESVEATLFLGPIENGQYSRFIIGIDSIHQEIMLSDNTHWEISCLDSSIFQDWSLNDYIIIGTNSKSSCWDPGSDSLLINVTVNNSARAKQF